MEDRITPNDISLAASISHLRSQLKDRCKVVGKVIHTNIEFSNEATIYANEHGFTVQRGSAHDDHFGAEGY